MALIAGILLPGKIGMMNCVLLLGLLATMSSWLVQRCRAEQQLTALERAVQEAEANMTANVVRLPALPEDVVRPLSDVVRTRLAGVAMFFCDTATPESAQQIIWRHQNATIHADRLPASAKGDSYYRQATSADTSYFFIHRVSRDSGGTVECLLPCDGQLCHVRTHNLLPRLRARDAFLAPLRNVSTPLRNFSMTCSGRVDCSRTGWEAHFIWKYDGRFVAAPYHALRILAGNSHTPGLLHSTIHANVSAPGARDTFCASTLTIIMSPAAKPPPARVDCWLRTDIGRHDWFVQSAYVHFTPSLR
ncbi:uncharacterized protein LOC129600787 [Paramacrobiotus metropolitanus]|uniref:uncharacterized protein LOC129600787 n=1 Tax=Paramacrobiotus metropolitanus TaxID=2943436 RepID=UPI00244614CA|nr:uncharacterized protein LOC129600787 [Paramacrobiotus metropolitanus]